MNSYEERMINAYRKRKRKPKTKKYRPAFREYTGGSLMDRSLHTSTMNAKSLGLRVTGAIPPKELIKSNHTVAPAYNKGPYAVISKQCVKDIGR